MLSKAEFVALNLIPEKEWLPMKATVNYRLINTDEQAFIVETLALMGIGAVLIFVFIGMLFKVLSQSTNRMH